MSIISLGCFVVNFLQILFGIFAVFWFLFFHPAVPDALMQALGQEPFTLRWGYHKNKGILLFSNAVIHIENHNYISL